MHGVEKAAERHAPRFADSKAGDTVIDAIASMTATSAPSVLATPIPSPNRPLVMVLGMHRSGTSLCSHMLAALGVDMADQLGPFGPPTPDNARGHWERWEIVALHDRVLNLLNRRYVDPTHDFDLPVAWWSEPRVAEVRREIIAFLHERMGHGHFGFKDPRTVRLLPLWNQITSELHLTPRFVFCLRNPVEVARSLQARDGLALDVGIARWFSYVLDFFRYSQDSEFCLIEYEKWFDDPTKNIKKLCEFLDLRQLHSDAELYQLGGGIIDADLHHHDSQHTQAKHPLVSSLYALARRSENDEAARAEIQDMVARFINFQQLHHGIYRRFEQVAETATLLPGVQQEMQALRQMVAERDAAIEQSRAQAETNESINQAAISGLQTQLQAAEQHKKALQDVLQATEQRVTATAQRVTEREAALASELSRLQEIIIKVELRRQARERALSASRIEIARLQDLLMQLELQRQEHEISLTASQTEITRLQDEATCFQTAAVEAETRWREEMTNLQQELSLARKVGRSLADALRGPC